MSAHFLFSISITLLISILTIESVYNPYLYDDGKGGEEHCCVVPMHGAMCLATPITRSLVQVNKECSRADRPRRRQFGKNVKSDEYLDKITRRLNVREINENDERVFIELQMPLKKEILENDLVCLTATDNKNNIDFEKCYVELGEDDYVPRKKNHRRKSHRRDKRSIDDHDEDETDSEEHQAKNEIRRIALSHPIRVREGEGLSFIQNYHLDRKHIRPTTSEQHRCWSWYRDQTRKIRKTSSTCLKLRYHVETCINDLVYNTFNHTESAKTSFPPGSKLYCKNEQGSNKYLGQYRRGKICFSGNDEISIEHKFTDINRLSDQYKSRDTLDFIGKNEKLIAEFEDDCHGQTHLVEISEPESKSNN